MNFDDREVADDKGREEHEKQVLENAIGAQASNI